MNCDDYRQAIAADPSFDGGAGHLSECVACQAYRSEMQELDQTISRALALDVPELQVPELPELIAQESPELSASRPGDPGFTKSKSGNVITLRMRQWSSLPRLSLPRLAVAATVVVAALLGIRFVGTGIEYDSLADEILAHVDHEQAALRVTDAAVSDERLASAVPANVAEVDRSAGLITYAQSCVINGHQVPHLVIQGARGPVTILLMPEEMIDVAQQFTGENVSGVILPVGNGSIAILGESEERLDRIKERVLKSVTWST